MAGIAYHPWYAVHGTKDFNDDKKWYETTVKVSSLYDCIVNAGTGNGRPDDKEANISYLSGQGGILCYSIPNANKPTYTHQEEVRRSLVDGYIENGVEIRQENPSLLNKYVINRVYGTITKLIFNSLNITNDIWNKYIYEGNHTIKTAYMFGDSGNVYNLCRYTGFNNNFIELDPIYGDVRNDFTAGKEYNIFINIKSPYLSTQGSMLHTDIIGDPSPYNSSDAAYIANDGNEDTDVTDMPTGTLVWDNNTLTMWKTKVDTIDLTDSTPSVAIEEGDNWTEVKKGYPQELRSLLASGKGVGFMNSLLVSDNGDSLIPDGTEKEYKLSKKCSNELHSNIFTNNSGESYLYNTTNWLVDSVTNNTHINTDPTNRLIIKNYQAQNQPAIQVQSPKPIKTVDKDLIATNSYSIYGYNGLNYAANGKIATGSSVESKSVDNYIPLPSYDKIWIAGSYVSAEAGEKVLMLGFDEYPTGSIYKRTDAYFEGLSDSSWTYEINWELIFDIPIIKNQVLNLDNQSITASKALVSQTENATQVFTQEISSGWDGTATFEDDVTTGLTIGTTYKESTTGGLYVAEADKITVSDTATWSYPAAYNDSGTFKQLTTGTTTDNSMNTIQTKVLLKASSIKV